MKNNLEDVTDFDFTQTDRQFLDDIRNLDYDPDIYFYLKLSQEHVKHVAPFYKQGEHILLSIDPNDNKLTPEDICIVSYSDGDHLMIYVNEDTQNLVFRGSISLELLTIKKENCKVFRVLKHEK